MPAKVSLPYNWAPREYQEPFWDAMLRGCRNAMLIWHRRAGKDLTAFNWAITDMAAIHPGGQWWHVWPTYEQGRKGWWEGADNEGRRFLDYIPEQLVRRKREDMMMLELTNGSIYRVVGAEDPDRLVGANPVGLIMTEFSLHNPETWNYLRPILAANGGTAIFPFTPRGRNHAHEMYMNVKDNEKWFVSKLSVEDSKALPLEILDDERDAGMSEELIQQEYYVSFNAPMSGAYYAEQMKRAEAEKRICRVAYDPYLNVETWWDIGIGDETAIWFVQRYGAEFHFIDYEEKAGLSLAEWINIVRSKPYLYAQHIGPHDLGAREMSTGRTRQEFALEHGLRFTLAPKLSVEDGIDAARRILSSCWFDEDKCFRGIEALKSYRKEWDAQRMVFRDKPLHDWSSHGADAFRTGTVGTRDTRKKDLRNLPRKKYDPYAASRPYGGV